MTRKVAMSILPARQSHSRPENIWARTRFVMLGTIHREPTGRLALPEWLDFLKPEAITLEFSEYGLCYRKTHAAMLLDRLTSLTRDMEADGESIDNRAVEAIRCYIDLPYEYVAVSEYCDAYRVPLFLVDCDEPSRVKLGGVDELLCRENLRLLFRHYESVASENRKERVLARLFFHRGVRVCTYTAEMLVRDRHIAERVSSLMAEHEHKRFAHVCGWQHLVDPQSIYARFNPVKVFVHDKSLCV